MEAKDIIAWRKMAYQVANCLEQHQLYAACVTGEATTYLFRDELYEFIHQLSSALNIDTISEKPRLWVVAGPVLNVSSVTERSVIVELYRDRLLNLFYSSYRQPIHYRIGGWMEKERTGQRDVVVDIYKEKYHPLSASVRKRGPKSGDMINSPDLVKKLYSNFTSLISSQDIVKIERDSDLDKFIFLTSEEIDLLRAYIIKKHTRKIFKKKGDKNKLNAPFFKELLEELDIQPSQYPEKVDNKKYIDSLIHGDI